MTLSSFVQCDQTWLEITDRQREIYAWIARETCRTGIQPSLDEAGVRFGVTKGCIHFHLVPLVRKGYLRSLSRSARALSFLRWPDGSAFLGLRPILRARARRRPSPLTEGRAALLQYLHLAICRDGFQPTNRELCRHFDIHVNAIYMKLRYLAGAGYLALAQAQPRAMTLLKLPDGSPFLGFKPVRAKEVMP